MAKEGPRLNPTQRNQTNRLSVLIQSMASHSEWPSLEAVILEARAAGLSLTEIHELVRTMGVTISSLPAADREVMAEEIRTARRQAAALLRDRLPPAPLTAAEREAWLTMARLLVDVGDFGEAAGLFETSGDDARAAEAWGAAGELVRMEMCLARDENRNQQQREMRDFLARFQALLAGGQRLAALELAASAPADAVEARDVRAAAADVARRLTQGRTLALRGPDGAVTRLASLPALLGRDGSCQIAVRDPQVSRRHARVLPAPAGFSVEDAGSRTGTRLCGAQLSTPVPLPAQGQLGLGDGCCLDFVQRQPGLLELSGVAGLDRGLHAFLGAAAIPLHVAFPAASGLDIVFEERCARATCVQPVRLAGQLVGRSFDLLHGDVIEVGSLRLEVL